MSTNSTAAGMMTVVLAIWASGASRASGTSPTAGAHRVAYAPILRAQHDRIGREIAPALEDIVKDYPELAGGDGPEGTAG